MSFQKKELRLNSLSSWAIDKERGEYYIDPLKLIEAMRTIVYKNQVLSQLPPLRLYNTFIQMKVTIMQPAYLPWLGYFDRIEMSDIMIYLDDVFFRH